MADLHSQAIRDANPVAPKSVAIGIDIPTLDVDNDYRQEMGQLLVSAERSRGMAPPYASPVTDIFQPA